MFSELPKILDRNFLIAFWLPAILLLAAIMKVLVGFEAIAPPPFSVESLNAEKLTATTLWLLASLLLALILMVLNFEIYRFLEGYPVASFPRLKARQIRRYQRLKEELDAEQDQTRLDLLGEELAERFPDEPAFVLPTGFGNSIRAFEVYPRVMYGIDAIPGWLRLQAVIPKDYRSLIDESKALTDFWVNLWISSYLILLTWIVLAVSKRELRTLWLPAVVIFLTYVISKRARTAAVGWGDLVKAAFDVFLPRLRDKLEISKQPKNSSAHTQWEGFSQAMIYRLPDSLPNKVIEIPTVLVFQYGSNTDAARLNSDQRLKGDAQVVGIAHTRNNFDLDFTVWSVTNDCAAANLIPGQGRKIWGVLYRVPEYLIKREASGNRTSLDAIEGEGTNYWRTEIALIDPKDPNSEKRAITYVAINPKPGMHTKVEYAKHILIGLREHNVPEDYLEYVKGRIIGNDPSLKQSVERI
jgi:hypothetical protein